MRMYQADTGDVEISILSNFLGHAVPAYLETTLWPTLFFTGHSVSVELNAFYNHSYPAFLYQQFK